MKRSFKNLYNLIYQRWSQWQQLKRPLIWGYGLLLELWGELRGVVLFSLLQLRQQNPSRRKPCIALRPLLTNPATLGSPTSFNMYVLCIYLVMYRYNYSDYTFTQQLIPCHIFPSKALGCHVGCARATPASSAEERDTGGVLGILFWVETICRKWYPYAACLH